MSTLVRARCLRQVLQADAGRGMGGVVLGAVLADDPRVDAADRHAP